MTPERRELAIKAGREMVERAARAVESGHIKAFYPIVSADDPALIVEVEVVKK